MDRRYDKYLVQKYEPLYRNRYEDCRKTAMCWGFEVRDGWFHLINELSNRLCGEWLMAKQSLEFMRIKGHYSDEKIKLAEQRVQYAYDTTPVAVQVKEKFGSLRFYTNGCTERHSGMIEMAEAMSSHICEVCGKPGRIVNINGWYSARCPEHAEQN